MPPTVRVHSDGPNGEVKLITLTEAGPTTAAIDIELVGNPNSREHFDVSDVATDAARSVITCVAHVFLVNPDVTVTIEAVPAGTRPEVTITVSHAVFGNGSTTYPLRVGEDGLLRSFLGKARFPVV